MEFDRARLMNNITFLIKEKGLKVGELENSVGISAGYISKMTKAENESMPGIDLIYKLAQKLDVSVEALVNGDFNRSNDNLLFLIKFLHSLQVDTDLHEIEWDFFREYSEIQEQYVLQDLPMLTRNLSVDMHEGESSFKFLSQFSVEANLTTTKENFCGFTSVGDALLFKLINHLPDNTKQTEYELYIIDDRGGGDEPLWPVCSSLVNNGELRPYLADLHNCLLKHSKDLRVTEDVRNLINRYLAKRSDEELPFN